MQRNFEKFEEGLFDLLVVGAGINGAWIAMDAAQRGLRVALVDKGDFGAATSAATGRMIHGGIRYMQHLSFGRLRRSLHERMLLLRNAPHLVHPLRFLIPTSGHGLQGKEILSLAMTVYDFFAANAVPGPPYALIPGHVRLSKGETLRLEPLLSPRGLTGGVCFIDCQMPFPERLTLAVIQSAHSHGALVANYVQAHELLLEKGGVTICLLKDVLTGEEKILRATCVVNATGPWLTELTTATKSTTSNPVRRKETRRLSKGIHIITRPLTSGHGLALATRHKHSGSWLDRGGRHFFIVPWEGLSLVGTTNVPFHGDPDGPLVTEEDIQGLIADVNSVYPAAGLCREDVRHFYGGLYPDDPVEGQGYQGGRKDVITDHAGRDGFEGMISVTCVKYTTARHLAERVVDLVARKLKRSVSPCRTESTSLYGGDIPGYSSFVASTQNSLTEVVDANEATRLVRLYGEKTGHLLRKFGPKDGTIPMANNTLLEAQTCYAVQYEMARRLPDLVFRRTDLGLRGRPAAEDLQRWAEIMGEKLGWTTHRIENEINAVVKSYNAG